MHLLQSLVLIPLIATSMVSPEVNMSYEGSVDVYTGAPAIEEDGQQVAQTVNLPDGSYYDRVEHTFNFPIAGMEEEVSTTVASGVITTESVAVTIPEGVDAVLYCDGNIVTDADLSNISSPGEYSIVVSGTDSEKQLCTFSIVNKKTGKLTSYALPDGFLLQSVTIDGELQATNYSGSVDFTKEGEYDVAYRCTATGISYNLRVIIDHTPPAITLEGLENGVARGPVTLSGLADEDTVTVLFNGEKASFPGDGIFRSVGKYSVTVTDDAQNSVTETFTIRMYLNVQGIVFILLAIAVVVGAGVYMYVSRKRLRVR